MLNRNSPYYKVARKNTKMETTVTLDLETFDDGRPRRKRARKARDLGPLHAMVARGLPDWIDEDGLLMSYDIAEYLGISYQALYKIFSKNRISAKRVAAIVKLSQESVKPFQVNPETGEPYEALTNDDFWEFMQ